MRILIISQYFWPENFKINDLCLGLNERGHEITVLTGKPNYPNGKFFNGYSFFGNRFEFWNGIQIIRAPLIPRNEGRGIQLVLNYFSFAIFASIRMLFLNRRFDRIFIFQPSPITVGIPGLVAKFKSKSPIFFWVQDLWPDSISAAGGINNKFVLKIINWWTKLIYRNSDKVLVQSKAFIPYILNQDVSSSKIIYYPNSTESFYKVTNPSLEILNKLPKGKILMFAGNIGESQSFDTLLNTALILKKEFPDLHWLVLGEGRKMEYVESKINELNLAGTFHLLGPYPSIDMPSFFSCADALIVSLKKNGIFSRTIPSKIQSYLACGKPIITSLDGEGSRIVEEAKAGFVCPSEDSRALANAVIEFFALSINEQKVLGYNARKYFESEFERELLLDRLEMILH